MATPFINGVQCTAMLANQMRCIRIAVRKKPEDPENLTALCEVCWRIQGAPTEYSVLIPGKAQSEGKAEIDSEREKRA